MTKITIVPRNHVLKAARKATRLDKKVYELGVKALKLMDIDPKAGQKLLTIVKNLQRKRDNLLYFTGQG